MQRLKNKWARLERAYAMHNSTAATWYSRNWFHIYAGTFAVLAMIVGI